MLIRSSARPQSLLRALGRPNTSILFLQNRRLHNRPALHHSDDWEINGVSGLMTPQTFRRNWTGYQQHLCDLLNEKTKGTVDEGLTPHDLVSKYSRDSSHAVLFNLASQAYNNAFFFQSLSSIKTDPTTHPRLHDEIQASFDDVAHLRVELLEAADAMFGNGYVWLMKDESSRLRVLCTYNAGSPLKEAHRRQQSRDLNTSMASRLTQVQNRVGAMGDRSAYAATHATAALRDADPILCVSCWQHMWLPDYGLLNQERVQPKQIYLASWWERIDWEVVARRSSGKQTNNTLRGRLPRMFG